MRLGFNALFCVSLDKYFRMCYDKQNKCLEVTMRFFHTADVHLGAVPDTGFSWSEERAEEIWESFRGLIQQIRQEKPELLLISGDLFHRQPLKRELKEVNYLFSTIPDTTVVLIAGNHDYVKADSWYPRYPWADNVAGLWKPEPESLYIPGADTWVYGFSYHQREIRDARYDVLAPNGKKGCHMLLAHGGDESHIPIRKEKLAKSGFDYIALGHIHRPQMLLEHKAGYAGALEPIDRNDMGPHGFIRGSFENGRMNTEFVPWSVRSYESVTVAVHGDMSQYELEERIEREVLGGGTRNIYRIRLQGFRDPQMNFNLHRLKQLGNIIDVEDDTLPDYDLEHLREQYEGSLIGDYIERFYECKHPVEKKALQYGLQALLASKR